jgi:hypothetical protein
VVVEEEGWILEPGEGMIPTAPAFRADASTPGEVEVLFLHKKEDSPSDQTYYRLLNSQSLFLVVGDAVEGSGVLDSQGRPADSLSFSELKEEILRASKAVGSGLAVVPSPNF